MTMEILQSSTLQVLATHKATLESTGSQSPYQVMFDVPIEIKPGVSYTASVLYKVSQLFVTIQR